MLLDTNALLLPFRGGPAVEREVARWIPGARLEVPSAVLVELDRLVARGVAGALGARAYARTLTSIAGPGSGDAAVVAAARATGAIVVTADRRLADRLVRAGLSVLVPRDRTRLELRAGRPVAATVKKRLPLVSRSGAHARRRPPARRPRPRVR